MGLFIIILLDFKFLYTYSPTALRIFFDFKIYSSWLALKADIAANCIGELTAENVSLAKTLIDLSNSIFFFGIIKYPSLHPPAPHHLLSPLLITTLSGQCSRIEI